MSGEYLSSWLCSAGVNVSGMFVSDENECVCSAGVNVSGISVSDENECVCLWLVLHSQEYNDTNYHIY